MPRIVIAALAAGTALAAAAPAAAQYSDPYPPRTRAGQVADEIARTVRETADAVAAVRGSVDSSLDTLRWGRAERFAIDRCRPYLDRYGAMRVDRVDPYGNRSLRVYGVTGYGGYADPRSFACTVRDDGRVKLKTGRLRRY
jgi:hypothetical protein